MRHGFRNAMIPVVTIIGLSLGGLLGGAVLTETIFDLSGVGRILFDAIQARDYAIVQGFTLVIAVIYVIVNLLVDIALRVPGPAGPPELAPYDDCHSHGHHAGQHGAESLSRSAAHADAGCPAGALPQPVGHCRDGHPVGFWSWWR